MILRWTAMFLALCVESGIAQQPRPSFDTFDVATVRHTDDAQQGRFLKMQTRQRFTARGYPLKLLIAAAYDLNPKTILGGPAWIESDRFDIDAVTPGEVQPTHDEQMTMLRSLLTERFQLTFHREQKEFAVYALDITKGGPKLKATATPEQPGILGPAVVYPQRISLPARNATTHELTSLLQRAIVDRPVVDRTGLIGHYDFDLDWAPDETQFGGDIPSAPGTAPAPPLFTALQQQLGLRLEPTRLAISTLLIDSAQKPSAN